MAERESGVRVAVTLPDDLGVHERPVLQEHVGKRPTVLVLALLIVLEPHRLPFDEARCEVIRLTPEALDGFLRMLRLRRVDANQADLLARDELYDL